MQLIAGVGMGGMVDDQSGLRALAAPEHLRAAVPVTSAECWKEVAGSVRRGTIVELPLRSCQERSAITA
jgi:hypothetical protein